MRCVSGLLFVTALVSFTAAQNLPAGDVRAGVPQVSASDTASRPLPDVAGLMHAVEAHQRQDEAKLKDYIYRETETFDETDGHGGVKKREVHVYDVFWLQGVPVRKMVSKDGRLLSTDELKKEDQRIDKEVKSAREKRERNEGKGKATDPRGDEVVTVSRILELGTFSRARRVQVAGRDAIAVDYAGDPNAKTRNKGEEVFRDVVGTAWIDEADSELVKFEGRFSRSLKIGGGLIASIKEGTTFGGEQRKINGEVWLPISLEARGSVRFLLFLNLNGSGRVINENFRKFKATSTLLPGVNAPEDESKP